MKKLTVTIIFVLFALISGFAQSLDYRQVVFGNAYKNINEIDADSFLSQYPQVKVHITAFAKEDSSTWTENLNEYRIYKQIIGSETFYRVLVGAEKLTDVFLLDWNNEMKGDYWEKLSTPKFTQFLFYALDEKTLCSIGDYIFYNSEVYDGTVSSSDEKIYRGVEIIERKDTVIGVMEYEVRHSKGSQLQMTGNDSDEYFEPWETFSVVKHFADYKLWKDIKDIKNQKEECGGMVVVSYNTPSIEVEASAPLMDKKRPFMYTIQNAFDGNPATSYVEDTEDDLFKIKGQFNRYFTINKLLIVNGYAASETLYKANNRIKDFFFGGTLKPGDELLEEKFYEEMRHKQIEDVRKKQLISFIPVSIKSFLFSSREVYSGTTYNDTCIAELNFFTEEQGWLFGAWEN